LQGDTAVVKDDLLDAVFKMFVVSWSVGKAETKTMLLGSSKPGYGSTSFSDPIVV